MKNAHIEGFNIFYNNDLDFNIVSKEVFDRVDYDFDNVESSKLIIDCGANIGLVSLVLSRKYPQTNILSFEANSDTFNCLLKNIQKNNIDNVTCINRAIYDECTELNFYKQKDDIPCSLGDGIRPWSESFCEKAPFKIKTVKLSDYINERVLLLKVDIESAEFELMKDLVESEKINFIDNIIMEIHYKPEIEEKFSYIINNICKNFKKVKCEEKDFSLIDKTVAQEFNNKGIRHFVINASKY